MKSLPANVKKYKSTKVFNNETIPAGLLRDHRTMAGVWGKIVVTKGELLFNNEAGEVIVLNREVFGVVEPQQIHAVKPIGEVEFYVEFYQ